MDGGAWCAAVHGVAKSRTRLSSLDGEVSLQGHPGPGAAGGWVRYREPLSTHSLYPNNVICRAYPQKNSLKDEGETSYTNMFTAVLFKGRKVQEPKFQQYGQSELRHLRCVSHSVVFKSL